MPARPITRDRLVAAVGWRLRRARRRIKARSPRAAPLPAARTAGLVEGFTKWRVSGWVAVRPEAPPVRVGVFLNDQEIAATWATDTRDDRSNWGEIRPFDFRLHDVWGFAKTKDQLTVRVDGKSMPINGHGMFVRPEKNGGKDLVALQVRLDAGDVFGQTGRLQLSKKLDSRWQATVMGLYTRVSKIVGEAYGYQPFFVYGTLLGAVREGGVIGHDLDFDAAYLSTHTDGPSAAREIREIAYLLIDNGLDVECMRTALHIHDADDPDARIDLFHLYFDASGKICFPFGIAGTTEIAESDWRGTKEIEFCGGRGLVPDNAEQFVEHMYGAGWRSPKPGFDWNRDRTRRDKAGIMPFEYGAQVLWANFYARHSFDAPSSFAEVVLARDDVPAAVIDLGCGDGRDSAAFAAAGRTVVGLDRSDTAINLAAGKHIEHAEFVVCDVSDANALRARLGEAVARADGPVLYYLRFLLCAIGAEAERTLLTVLDEVARPGDLFAAEFRTDNDEKRPKAFGKHFRRFQPGPEFGVALATEHGLDILDEQSGTGLAQYRDEDPDVYRVVARRRA